MGTLGNLGDAILHFKGDTKNLDKAVNDVKTNVTKLGKNIAGGLAAAVAAGTAALGAMASQAVDSYAQLEQSVGGAKLMFEEGFDFIEEKSKSAYKTLGLSANQYLYQANGFAVGLREALGGNGQAAAELTDKILTAEADIVAATGRSQEAVQNAFNGIMKGNYVMLDNLALGIKPTKEGMQEVIDKVNEWNAAQGKATNYQMDNYADMQSALVDYVEMQGLAGYAAREAQSTITGSVAAVKAAFDNFLNGSGGATELADAVLVAFGNISKAFLNLLPDLVNGLVTLINGLIPQVPDIINGLLPPLITGAVELVKGLAKALPALIKSIIEGAIMIIQALAEALPEMIPAIVDAILEIIPIIIDNLPLFIEAGVQLLIGLLEGIMKSTPKLLEAIPKIIKSLIKLFGEMPNMIIDIGKNLIKGLWNGIVSYETWIINKIKGFGNSVLKAIKGIFGIHSPSTEFAWIGKMNMVGFEEGMEGMKTEVQDTIDSMFNLQPNISGNMSTLFNPSMTVNVQNNMELDPLGQLVNKVKTFSGGAKNDYNWGAGL